MPLLMNNETNQVQLQAASLSVCGPTRDSNQDAVYSDVGQIVSSGQGLGLFIVCDGLGSHQAGEVASQLAISVIVAAISSGLSRVLAAEGRLGAESIQRIIGEAISEANFRVFERRQGPEPDPEPGLEASTPKPGTTVTLALVYEGVAYGANVGDSRLYLGRDDQVAQITQDHSLAAELARQGHISPDEIADHPHSNILSRALGPQDEIEVDLYQVDLQPEDRLLLCSDGLWKAFGSGVELNRLLTARMSPEDLIHKMVAEALRRDGSDNVSGVVVELSSAAALKSQPGSKNGSQAHHRSRKQASPAHQQWLEPTPA
jgi:serine/threonine protein phosphatase PrpC